MAGNFLWGAAAAIPGAPVTIVDGALGSWGQQNLTALANVSHIGYQIEFGLGADEVGQVDFYISSSIDGSIDEGGQNEPATLTRLAPIQLNGFAANYVTPLMILNQPLNGIWPPFVRLKALPNTAGSSITIVSSVYRTAQWIS